MIILFMLMFLSLMMARVLAEGGNSIECGQRNFVKMSRVWVLLPNQCMNFSQARFICYL